MKIKTKLKNLISDNELRNYVISYVLDDYKTDKEIKGFFEDLSTSGCVSGMIRTLIYHDDTKAFFIEYIEEIGDLVYELQGEGIKIDSRMYNFYSWLAFEETARNLSNKIGLDL